MWRRENESIMRCHAPLHPLTHNGPKNRMGIPQRKYVAKKSNVQGHEAVTAAAR